MSIDSSELLALVSDADLLAECSRRRLGQIGRAELTQLVDEVRRRGAAEPEGPAVVRLPGLVVDPIASTVHWRGETMHLGGRNMEVLYALAVTRYQGRRLLQPAALASKVWRGWPPDSSLPCLRVAVSQIRKVLPGLIASKPRFGYWLEVDAGEAAA